MAANQIAEAARRALSEPGFEAGDGYCSRWCRQVVQSVTRDFDACFGADANTTGRLLKLAGYAVSAPPQAGDLLVKVFPPHGHIGIYLGDGSVAENSTVHWKRSGGRDARGRRGLAAWGRPDIIARLPGREAAPPLWRVLINNVLVARAMVVDGRAYVPVRRFEEALGLEVGWREDLGRVVIAGKVAPAAPLLVDGESHLPARDLAAFHGLTLDLPEPQTLRFRR